MDDKALWNELLKHHGHHIHVAVYGDPKNPANVALECEDCNEILFDAGVYTLAARTDCDGSPDDYINNYYDDYIDDDYGYDDYSYDFDDEDDDTQHVYTITATRTGTATVTTASSAAEAIAIAEREYTVSDYIWDDDIDDLEISQVD